MREVKDENQRVKNEEIVDGGRKLYSGDTESVCDDGNQGNTFGVAKQARGK